MKHFSKPRIYEFKKIKLKEIIAVIENKPWIVFIFFGILIFILFRSLFGSYFEADEWFHFTYYLPLTRQPDGFLTALVSTIINTGPLSGGQHISPIATVILFLSTKFFGLNFVPYAFVTLLLHTLNSFLVFLLIKILLYTMKQTTKNVFAFMGAIFFAFAPSPVHTITGAAAFYSYNVLSVTFFLLSVILFKIALIKGERKFIYFSVLLLFGALFTKETAAFLFLLLPFMVLIEKRAFPLRFLAKLFVFCIIIYAVFRFLVPNITHGTGPLIDKLVNVYISSTLPSWQQTVQPTSAPKSVDTGTIVSRDLSIHKNLPAEILFRTVTFPIKMTGTLFFPRQTVFSIVQFITPIVQPVPPGGDSADMSQARLTFLYGPGNGFIIYIASLGILIFCASLFFGFIRKREVVEARALATGLAIIVFSALPLVAIIFSFPRWGYDFYFDSRHYYNPNVGAAIVFPFLLFGIAKFVSKPFRKKTLFPIIVFILFIVWLYNNMIVLNAGIKQFTQNFQPDRREVVTQFKKYLPALPKRTVFYIETDGLSAYGPILPFQTSVPQALTVVYYDKNPLPDSFFEKPLFDGMPQGYSYSQGRGFGYYTSKKSLSEALILKKFELSDVHAFYYKSLKVKLLDNTLQVRKEMQDYLNQADILNWKKFNDSSLGIKFLYPQSTNVEDLKSADVNTVKSLLLKDPQFNAEAFFINVASSFNIHDNIQFLNRKDVTPLTYQNIIEKNVFFDKYHSNKATETDEDMPRYFMKFNDILIYIKTENSSPEGLKLVERILGSLEIINEK